MEALTMMNALLSTAIALTPFLVVIALLRVADSVSARSEASHARQIALTDAIHRELGAVAAPVVSASSGRRMARQHGGSAGSAGDDRRDRADHRGHVRAGRRLRRSVAHPAHAGRHATRGGRLGRVGRAPRRLPGVRLARTVVTEASMDWNVHVLEQMVAMTLEEARTQSAHAALVASLRPPRFAALAVLGARADQARALRPASGRRPAPHRAHGCAPQARPPPRLTHSACRAARRPPARVAL